MDVVTNNPVVKSFLAGSFSGTCSTILFQPLDLVKTRIQQNAQCSANAHAGVNSLSLNVAGYGGRVALEAAAASNPATNYRPGIYATLRLVISNDTVLGLWRGITPSITRTVPGVGLYFGSLHWLKTTVGGGTEKPSPLQAIALGMTARSVAGCAMIPITVIKTRFESGTFGYTRMSSALVEIWRSEGLRGLCCGLVPTLVRDAPYSGLYLMFYTQLKQHVAPYITPSQPLIRGKDELDAQSSFLSSLTHFSCGIVAGLLASTVTHPADVVKTQMQLRPTVYRTVSEASKLIWMASGYRGFLVGLAPRMLRRTLMSALAWTVYEEIMRRLKLK